MSSSEPINFQHERRKRKPDEEAAANEQRSAPPSPSKQTPLPAPKLPPPVQKKELRCSCCAFTQARVKVFLDLGRGVLLCDGCIALCNGILNEEGITTEAKPTPKERFSSSSYSNRKLYHCSICEKEQANVARLIAMLNNLYICNRCVGTCSAAIAQAISETVTETKSEGSP